ncbi:phage protein [Streptococcus gallolyticus]|uniref:Phage protein n=1 Tax=Streptococcus gallolyticus TaxID=315405 RepID=A0AA94M0X8_9STRE|nr:phage tail protein [Streptococcus gallolyticus]AQP41520.1 phage protein [Streptococcus gallolyticus subsp. gallolyticus DSM 16831]SQG78807.1 phage protein [Streptococcus gallolyticus]
MITFLDENDVEYGALSTIKATNAVNGERSLTGTIVSGDYVLSNLERGWRLRFDDEYYVVTYAKPIDEGRDVQVTFDAVHQFFWDFDKSSVYDQLTDGSHTFVAYLDFIFKNSGYSYTVDSALNVYAFEKQSFGLKKRLTLFNDVITSTGVEFQVNGKVVRILEKVGTDLSTVVRKNFNMNELTIEKNIGDFVTYQKGYGAYFDEEDHSKGRLEVEYTSTLASVYGKLEAEPLVDERYTQSSSLLSALKENVDNSYTISVSLDMEDLTRAGYKYTQPIAGDYIMAINETLDFQEKIRIVSFTSEYDVQGTLVKHEVTCNDIGTAKKLTASYNTTKRQASTASVNATRAYSIANRALVSADGKNTNYYGNSFPQDTPKGTLKTGDLLFLTVGDTVKQYYWNGADWIINPVVSDVEAFKEQIAEELKEVPDREEFEATIAQELATSKVEIETQIDTAKTQAETNAKAYADEINQATAEVAAQANTTANSLKSDLAKVQTDLTTVSNTANSAKTSASEAKQQLTAVANDLNTAKQDLQTQASQLQAQASAQIELTNRVSSVEETANGTKTAVSELSKTVDSNTQNITSVTARTKVVEDDLASTKTTLSQVQTTANSASSKTTTLETGLNGLTAKFETLKIGSRNYFKNSKSRKYYINSTETQDVRTYIDDEFWQNDTRFTKNYVRMSFDIAFNPALPSNFTTNVHFSASPWYNCGGITFKGGTTALQHFDLKFDLSGAGDSYKTDNVFIRLNNTLPLNTAVSLENFNLYLSAVVEDYSQNEADIESKVAEYKQTAEQNYASLQSNLQTLDGTVKQNKSEFDQTASQIKSSISAVEGKASELDGDITKLNTTLTQTANGLEQLSTQVTSQGNTITSHTNSINSLSTGLSAKVSQTDFNTLSGRVTTAENNITAKANELSSKISSVEGNIPSGEMNLVEYGRPADGYSPYKNAEYATHSFYYNGAYKMYIIKNTATSEKMLGMNHFKVERNTDYTLYFKGFNNSAITHMDVWFLKRVNGSTKEFDSAQILVSGRKLSISKAEDVSVTFNTGNYDEGYIRFDNNGSTTAGTEAQLFFGDVSVKKGKSNNGWSPSQAELASSQDLKIAQSEIKMTTDLISMNLSALDDSTVKSASLTINADGIVMKAGKSTTDVANAIGAYFAVNQNAINLFSDKINVKANMIVDGAITSAKIASKSINTAHLNGKIITADVISSNAITADAIKAGAVTTDKMTANSINGDRITVGTLDAAKIKAGSITASQIASGTITSNQIKAGGISAANIATGAITADKIAANSINSDKIVSNGLTADVIKGGTLTATNNAMQISLTTGKLEFFTSAATMRRVLTDYPNQFIKFDTGMYGSIKCGVTVIGSNRNGSSENSNDGAFAGVRIWNGYNNSDAMDRIELVGDTIRLVHSAYDSPKGWEFYNWNNNGSPLLKLYGADAGQRAGSYIEAGDIHIMRSDGTYMSLKSILNTFNGNFSANGGTYYPNGI